MSRRTWRPLRVSRSLMGLLAVVVAAGGIYYYYNMGDAPTGPAPAMTTPVATRPPPATAPAGPDAPKAVATALPALAVPTSVTPGAAPTPPAAAPVAASTAPTTRQTGPLNTNLADAQAKQEAGDLIAAREILNNALLAGGLSLNQQSQVKSRIAELNQTLVFSPRKFPNDPFMQLYTVQPGDRLTRVAPKFDTTAELIQRINAVEPRRIQAGQKLKVLQGPINAVVDKSDFMMDLYIGNPGQPGSMFLTRFPVGLGADDSTPTGVWQCTPRGKVINPVYYSPRGEGVIAADDPKNPLGERWIALEGIEGQAVGKTSYGIHGTIEPQSIGTMASMGCIRLLNENVEVVYELLVDGKSTVKVIE